MATEAREEEKKSLWKSKKFRAFLVGLLLVTAFVAGILFPAIPLVGAFATFLASLSHSALGLVGIGLGLFVLPRVLAYRKESYGAAKMGVRTFGILLKTAFIAGLVFLFSFYVLPAILAAAGMAGGTAGIVAWFSKNISFLAPVVKWLLSLTGQLVLFGVGLLFKFKGALKKEEIWDSIKNNIPRILEFSVGLGLVGVFVALEFGLLVIPVVALQSIVPLLVLAVAVFAITGHVKDFFNFIGSKFKGESSEVTETSDSTVDPNNPLVNANAANRSALPGNFGPNQPVVSNKGNSNASSDAKQQWVENAGQQQVSSNNPKPNGN